MSSVLKITFLAAAEADDTLVFDYYALFPDTGVEFARGETFKVTRSFPGQCEIGGSAIEQAENYVTAFSADYLGGGHFSISRDLNVVTITCLNGSDIFDALLNVGATFATFDTVETESDNMIHVINFTPRQYASAAVAARNYLITETELLILTEDGKKIRL